MSDNQNPSLQDDPATVGSVAGMVRFAFRKLMQSTDGMLPCKVLSVTTDRNYVRVQPQIMVLGTNDLTQSRAEIDSVPVLTMGAGSYVISFPIKEGDFGWIIANDRHISLYLNGNKESQPNTNRLKDFADSIFIPDKARQWTLDGADADKLVIQSLDGTAKITIGTDQITLKHGTKIELDAPTVHITHDLTAEGTINGKTDVVGGSGSISLKGHKHTGVTTGGGTSGGPTN